MEDVGNYEKALDSIFGNIGAETRKALESDDGFEPLYINPEEQAEKKKFRKKGTAQESPKEEKQEPQKEIPGILEYYEDKKSFLEQLPQAFIEPEEKMYERDAADGIEMDPGFITDFVNTTRGMEIPTLFVIWGALWAVSTALSREAWLKWYPKQLWPNLYVLTVAPPGLCHKSTAMDIAKSALEKMVDFMPDTATKFRKETNYITGKCTSDALLMSLAPAVRTFVDMSESSIHTVDRGSHVALAISELAMFLGKQQYNINLVTTLTDLYDCKDSDSEVTRSRGVEPLRNVYVTFCGATTPDSLKSSIPEEALGGGFLSRLVVVYQDLPTKICPIPMAMFGYPTPESLPEKLAWISYNMQGEFYLTPEAMDFYSKWYHSWKKSMFENMAAESAADNRRDTLLLRLALLMRAQEYRPGRDITLKNIECAKNILDYTLRTARPATEDLGMNEYTRFLNGMRRYISKRGSVQRVFLQRNMSARGCKVNDFNQLIQQLFLEDFITIEMNGQKLQTSSGSSKEIYSLTEYGREKAAKEGQRWKD